MPLTLLTGPANSAKARAVLDGVRAALDREPLLVVPTREDVDRYRRELAEQRLVMGARVVTFNDLLAEAAARAGVVGRPLGELARERVVGSVVARAELRALGASAATPGFARAAGRFFAELEVARVEPGRLAAGLRAWAGEADGDRARYGEEIAWLYGAYRAALERLGRRDRGLWALAALDGLRLAPAAWGATPVFFYGFDDLTPLQLDVVETLAKAVDADVWVSLTFEAGRVAFGGRARTVNELEPLADERRTMEPEDAYYEPASRPALHALERRLFEDSGGAPPVDPGGAVALLEAGGERAEAELVGAEVLRLLGEGVPAEEIAVVARSLDEVGPLLERVLGDFGIPLSLRRRVPFGRTALGRGLLALLRCALLDGSAADLVAYLRAPGVLRHPELADGLERTIRRRGTATAAEALALWAEHRDEPPAIGKLRRAAARGADALCEALAGELQRMLARTSGASPAPSDADAPQAAENDADPPHVALSDADAPHADAPAEPLPVAVPPDPPFLDAGARAEARAAAVARRALAELAALAREAPPLAPTPAELAAHLGGVEVRIGDAPGAGRVTVCDPLALRARRVRALVLCSLQEGGFPRAATPEPFFSDAERRQLARASGIVLPTHEDALGAERYLFYATVSRPVERLVLSTRTADDDGDPAVPSFFLDDVRDVLAPLDRTHRPLGAVAWPHDAAPTPRAAVRAHVAAAPPRRPAPIAPLTSEPILRELREKPAWSPSALESYAACPVKWFVERYLHADDLGPDSEPLVRGSVAHAALERTLAELRERTGSAKVRPETLDTARELLRAALREIAAQTRLSPSPERLAAGVRRLEADLERYLEAAAHDGSAYEPAHIEATFGFQDEEPASLPPLRLDAPDGPIALRGRIDRIDVESGTNRVQVIDYKTGKATEGARWERDRSFQAALYLRAATDLLGLEGAGAFYQPLSAADARRRGLIVEDADPGLDVVGPDRKPAEDVQRTLDTVIDLALAAAAQARSGALEPRPETCTSRGCAFPGLCRCEAA